MDCDRSVYVHLIVTRTSPGGRTVADDARWSSKLRIWYGLVAWVLIGSKSGSPSIAHGLSSLALHGVPQHERRPFNGAVNDDWLYA
eukprot:1196109-Prorocentrum_minimum.AAC.2